MILQPRQQIRRGEPAHLQDVSTADFVYVKDIVTAPSRRRARASRHL